MGTRWLDPDEQRAWRAFLEGSRHLWERLEKELDAGSALSLAEYEILVRLSEEDDRSLRMSQLADAVVQSRSRLTHTATRLEDRGLVIRRRTPEDRRGVVCTMTDAGHDLLVASAPVHVEGVRTHLFDLLTDEEVEVIGRGLARVREHLREG